MPIIACSSGLSIIARSSGLSIIACSSGLSFIDKSHYNKQLLPLL
jgi:hypothetical protein